MGKQHMERQFNNYDTSTSEYNENYKCSKCEKLLEYTLDVIS